jgi:hypothetical protein
MMCRRIHELLSAYIDGELSAEETFKIQAHLDRCGSCCNELESLRQTKRLLGELARQRPRAELEYLLVIEARRAENRVPSPFDGLRRLADTPIRPRTALATAALSLAALWAATTQLGGPSEQPSRRSVPTGTIIGQVPVYDAQGTLIASYQFYAVATPAPRIRLPEPPVRQFLEQEPPGLLTTASWSSAPVPYQRQRIVTGPYSPQNARLDQMFLIPAQ